MLKFECSIKQVKGKKYLKAEWTIMRGMNCIECGDTSGSLIRCESELIRGMSKYRDAVLSND